MNRTRCSWPTTPLDIKYHDREWGTPVHDDQVFFEFLVLEGAQAGLSWATILNKRANYRKAFAGLDPAKVAKESNPSSRTVAAFETSPLGARLQSMLVERDGRWLGLATLNGVHDGAALAALDAQTRGQVRLLDLKGASESLVVAYRARILHALIVAILLLALTVAVAFQNLRRAGHVLPRRQ